MAASHFCRTNPCPICNRWPDGTPRVYPPLTPEIGPNDEYYETRASAQEAELARLRQVEQAARAVVEHFERNHVAASEYLGWEPKLEVLMAHLAQQVRGDTDEGEKP